eukprot:155636-Hanusia_phi.AAC.1
MQTHSVNLKRPHDSFAHRLSVQLPSVTDRLRGSPTRGDGHGPGPCAAGRRAALRQTGSAPSDRVRPYGGLAPGPIESTTASRGPGGRAVRGR